MWQEQKRIFSGIQAEDAIRPIPLNIQTIFQRNRVSISQIYNLVRTQQEFMKADKILRNAHMDILRKSLDPSPPRQYRIAGVKVWYSSCRKSLPVIGVI